MFIKPYSTQLNSTQLKKVYYNSENKRIHVVYNRNALDID